MERRRGVLLLVVLSTLIVFLLLGTLLLTQSTRSRTAARAFAKMNASSSSNGALARDVLDEALMQLVRGDATDDPTQATDSTNPTNDSILLDKYHGSDPVRANATEVWLWPGGTGSFQYNPSNDQPFLRVVIDSPSSGPNDGSISNPLELNGRIITFLPSASQTGTTSSYRIVRANASGGGYEIFVLNMNSDPGATLPTTQCPVIINSPEFRTEGHDSFTDDNWLTQVNQLINGEAKVLRPAFYPLASVDSDEDGVPDTDTNPADGIHDDLTIDNDGDGLPDGVWRDASWRNSVFPTRILSDGTELEFDVSYLVQDLDSRVNINAHSTNPVANGDWVTPPTFIGNPNDFEDIPSGAGWGVADVQATFLFKQGTTDPPPDIARIKKIRTGASASGQTTSGGIRHPYVGAVDGALGMSGRAGGTSQTAPTAYEQLLYGGNATIDLKSLAKMYVDTSGDTGNGYLTTSSLRYAFTNSSDVTYLPNFPNFPFVADPYELRLDAGTARLNTRASTNTPNAIFSLTEFERISRLYDKDANALPQRLAAVLDSDMVNVRTLLTTDSWDTPALTGTVARDLETYFTGLPNAVGPYDLLSPDLAAGRRFDVNRPVETLQQKQLYCRDLFVLLVALGATPDADLAQWVVNVMDYRDPDSTITSFEWDDDLTDGWDPSGNDSGNGPDPTQATNKNPVYGTEKPELVIGQTIAWYDNGGGNPDGELFVLLHRPPAEFVDVPESPPIPVSPLSDSLSAYASGSYDNTKLDLGRRVDPDPAETSSSAVWRLRYYRVNTSSGNIISGTEKYVLFDLRATDLPTAGDGDPYDDGNTSATKSGSSTNATDAAQIKAGEYVLVGPPGSTKVTVDGSVKAFSVEHGEDMKFNNPVAANDTRYRVALERLRDPTLEFNASTNPYVAIDEVPVRNQNDSGNGAGPNYKSYKRKTPGFWSTPTDENIGKRPFAIGPLDDPNRDILNWPNRPFISQVELALVPQGGGRDVFNNIRTPSGGDYFYLTDNSFLTTSVAQQLLAATYVPSRYTGTSVTFGMSSLSQSQRQAVGFARDVSPLSPPSRDVYPANAPQIAKWREPGRMNVNTMPMEPNTNALTNYNNQRLWRALFGSGSIGPNVDDIVAEDDTQTPFASKAKQVHELLSIDKTNELYLDTGTQSSLHPVLAYRTAIKLGNVGTIRSNVFAVWITLRVTNTQTQASTSHRLFAIVDRSIPVAFAPGQNLNSANTIRLKRYLD